MTLDYKNYFQELSNHIAYNVVFFLKETGDVLAYKTLKADDYQIPKKAKLQIDYEMIPSENSRVFYGVSLTFDQRQIICSGSVHLIDLQGATLVIVFYDARVKSFRDHQLPRIFWKNQQGRYLGHSEYVPYESNVSKSMVGEVDYQLFDPDFLALFKETDEEVLEMHRPMWDLDGRIIINQFHSLVTLQKIPYYFINNQLAGLITVYIPVTTVNHLQRRSDIQDVQKIHQVLKALMVDSNVYFVILQKGEPYRFEYYTDNFSHFGYEMSLFQSGALTFADLLQPTDRHPFYQALKRLANRTSYKEQLSVSFINHQEEKIPMEIVISSLLDETMQIEGMAILSLPSVHANADHPLFTALQAVINQTHVSYLIEDSEAESTLLFVSNNIEHFGFSVEKILADRSVFRQAMDSDSRLLYEQARHDILTGQKQQVTLEYRIQSPNLQEYWVREVLTSQTIQHKTTLLSAIWNTTSSHHALKTLESIPGKNEINPEAHSISFTTMSRVLEHDDYYRELEANYHCRLVILNNQQRVIYNQLVSDDELNEYYQRVDMKQPILPQTTISLRQGQVHQSRLSHKNQLMGFLLVFETGTQNEQLISSLPVLSKTITILLQSISVAMMQSQSSMIYQGDLTKQRLSHSVLLELLSIANHSRSIEECFLKIIPKVKTIIPLSRASIFQYQKETEQFSCTVEWYESFDQSRKDEYQNLKKADSLYQDWNLDTANAFVIHYDTPVVDVLGIRPFAQAIVGIKLATKDSLYGSINFVDNRRNRKWTQDEVVLFENIGSILSSVEERAQKQATIRKGTQQYFRTLDSLPSPSVILDGEVTQILFANRAFRKQFIQGVSTDYLEESIDSIHPNELEYHKPKEVYLSYFKKWFLIQKTPVNYLNDRQANLFIFTDITATKEAETKMESLAYQDLLTGFPNRLRFEHDLKSVYQQKSTSYGNSFIGLINIDNFKLMNTSYGYSFGDELLKNAILKLDSIPELHGCMYRFGGDEFAFIVKNLYGEQIYEIAQKIMHAFENPFLIMGYEVGVTISLGLAFLTESNADALDLIRKVNLSVNDAKSSGKNKFILYDASLRKYQEDTLSIELALKKALKNGLSEFSTVYQPIVDVSTKTIVSAEALMRWYSPELGQVSPVKFIPIAESSGLIIPLGASILDQSVKQIRQWLDMGYEISVAVNFSVVQMLQADLISSVLSVLQKHRVPPRLLTIEITESLAMNDINKVIDILNSLKGIGIRIAIDDFGTGYSSLNHLRRLPLDYVKIDRSFIFNIDYDPYTVAFVDTITQFCHLKNTRVCCEGVETDSQRKMLEKVRVDLLQGYLFSKPISAAEFTNLLPKKT